MSLVLIVEDEAMLRASLARGIGKMDGIEVVEAANVDQALERIDARAPDLIVSDIDMPERTGIELVGELGRRGLSLPIIYVSAYLKAYRAQLPPHANIEVVEKPVALDDIRALILEKLGQASEGNAEPFSVPDFLQLAGMGRRSVVIEANWADGTSGTIVIHEGEVWDARLGTAVGLEAFTQLAWREGARVRCRTLSHPATERTLEGSAESLLMDTARHYDEQRRDRGEPSRVERAQRFSSMPPADVELERAFPISSLAEGAPSGAGEEAAPGAAPEGERAALTVDPLQAHLDAGLSALLGKDFAAAFAAFVAARDIQPDHPTVQANIQRLEQMGFGPAEPEGDEHDAPDHHR